MLLRWIHPWCACMVKRNRLSNFASTKLRNAAVGRETSERFLVSVASLPIGVASHSSHSPFSLASLSRYIPCYTHYVLVYTLLYTAYITPIYAIIYPTIQNIYYTIYVHNTYYVLYLPPPLLTYTYTIYIIYIHRRAEGCVHELRRGEGFMCCLGCLKHIDECNMVRDLWCSDLCRRVKLSFRGGFSRCSTVPYPEQGIMVTITSENF